MTGTATAKAPSALKSIVKGKVKKPRRTIIYGVHGVGKSTFGAMSNKPIFIQTEDGLDDIDCDRFPLCICVSDVLNAIGVLYNEKHDYKTVVIDSLDWLEQLIWAQVCVEHNKKSIEEIGYAKGYVFALSHWRNILDGFNALRNERGMDIILVAHAEIVKFDNPETDPYDRYTPKLHRRASALVQEWADEVLFATYKVHTKQTDEGFNRKRTMGIGDGERILRTCERPAHLAKNRLGLPEEMPLDHRIYSAFVRGENPLATPDTSTNN